MTTANTTTGETVFTSAATLAVAYTYHKTVAHTSKAAMTRTVTNANTTTGETVLTSAATLAVAYTLHKTEVHTSKAAMTETVTNENAFAGRKVLTSAVTLPVVARTQDKSAMDTEEVQQGRSGNGVGISGVACFQLPVAARTSSLASGRRWRPCGQE